MIPLSISKKISWNSFVIQIELVGGNDITRSFGLDLLETALNSSPALFHKHTDFAFLLKDRVCSLVIKLFSPSLKVKLKSYFDYYGRFQNDDRSSFEVLFCPRLRKALRCRFR